jgi:hypothetical protein
MSHHYSGPDYGFPHGDARLDLTDLYVFAKPGDAGKSILIMNVHPSAGVNPPGPTTEYARWVAKLGCACRECPYGSLRFARGHYPWYGAG